jgi:toxin secretion/phage lysis holin
MFLDKIVKEIPAIELLVWLSVLDMISGVIVACIKRKLNSSASFTGVLRKALMFTLVMATLLLERETGYSVGKVTALWFSFSEIISITENLHAARVPLPLQIVRWLKKAQEEIAEKFEQKRNG